MYGGGETGGNGDTEGIPDVPDSAWIDADYVNLVNRAMLILSSRLDIKHVNTEPGFWLQMFEPLD
jgi:hypothetical protein